MTSFLKKVIGINITINIAYTLILTVWDMINNRDLSMHEREFAISMLIFVMPLMFLQVFSNFFFFFLTRKKREAFFITAFTIILCSIVTLCIGLIVARTANQNEI